MCSISVILPVYNARGTLKSAVESLEAEALNRAHPGSIEVIAVEDGSTDGSAELLAEMSSTSPWLRVLRIPHSGIVAALNTGIEAAKGEFIVRMDADDLSLPGRLPAQRDFLAENPDIGLVGGRVEFGGDHWAARGYALHVDWLNSLRTSEEIQIERFVESPFAHPSVMFRRKLVGEHGGYRDGAFPEDYELWLRWMDAGVRMARIDFPVLRWNDPPKRLSRTDSRYDVLAFYDVKAQYLSRWLATHNPLHPDVIIWGAGRITRQRARKLQAYGIEIRAWVDIDPAKIGHRIENAAVISPDDLPPPGSCFIIPYVGRRNARTEIAAWLVDHGYMEGVHFLCAA